MATRRASAKRLSQKSSSAKGPKKAALSKRPAVKKAPASRKAAAPRKAPASRKAAAPRKAPASRKPAAPKKARPVQAEALSLVPLTEAHLDAVVELDAQLTGHSRRGFYEKHLQGVAKDQVQLAAMDGDVLQGFVLAHLLEGEFGADAPVAVVDAVGVSPALHGKGLGEVLLSALEARVLPLGVRELSTQVSWHSKGLLSFFSAQGFSPASYLVLERQAEDADFDQAEEGDAPESGSGEADYSQPSGDDAQALARDRVPVRSMTDDDLDEIVDIDRHITGRNRQAFFDRQVDEVLRRSGVRVSLVAEQDGRCVGYLMARVDLGAFGRTEPVAVIDALGVHPAYGRKQAGKALLSQLFHNLQALRIETVRTQVAWKAFGLVAFFAAAGFTPGQRLALRKPLAPAA